MKIDENKCPANHRCPLVTICPVDAIVQKDFNSLPIIDNDKCIECEDCVTSCPMKAVIK